MSQDNGMDCTPSWTEQQTLIESLEKRWNRLTEVRPASEDEIRQYDVFMVTQGEHSDYHVVDICLALKTFKPLDEIKRYFAEKTLEDRYRWFDYLDFLTWLRSKGYIRSVNCSTFHLGEGEATEATFNSKGMDGWPHSNDHQMG